MKCPKCEIEMRISKSQNVLKSGKLLRRLTFMCRNKECENYNKEVKTEEVELSYVEQRYFALYRRVYTRRARPGNA